MLDFPETARASLAAVIPDDSESAIVLGVAWAALVVSLVTAANVRRWRRVLRDAAERGVTVPVHGRRSFARRLAEWSLAASVLLGACGTPNDTPGIEQLGPSIDSTSIDGSSVAAATVETTSSSVETTSTTQPPTTQPPTTPDTTPEIGEHTRNPPPADAWEPTTDLPVAHIVQPGEHLWGIAEVTVRRALGRDASSEAIATYWVELLTENRSMLKSGDPDLIHPGETLLLPPMSVLAD